MSDPKDIVGKADAFLGRYRPAGGQEVPVLTEVVDLPGAAPAVGGEASRPPGATFGLSEAELLGIERQVTQRVLEAIRPTLSELLEQALRVALQGRVEQAISTLTEQCTAHVDAIVREAVTRTVEREVQQLRQPRPADR